MCQGRVRFPTLQEIVDQLGGETDPRAAGDDDKLAGSVGTRLWAGNNERFEAPHANRAANPIPARATRAQSRHGPVAQPCWADCRRATT